MPKKYDGDATNRNKLLKLFRKLMVEGKKHYLSDLAYEFNCSPQTILRLVNTIEAEIGINLETGKDGVRRWFQIRSLSRSRLGLDFEELRYLAICRDLAEPYLPEQVKKRIDESLLNFSLLMADSAYAKREVIQKKHISFYSKGYIDYTEHYEAITCLSEQIEKKKLCVVYYKALGKRKVKKHIFAPHKFTGMNGSLYCLGAIVNKNCETLRYFSSLAVHRIIKIIALDLPVLFDFPEIELDKFGFPRHEPKKFVIKFSSGACADYIKERVWSDEQKIKTLSGGEVLLEIITQSEPELMAWVRSFGKDAQLIQ